MPALFGTRRAAITRAPSKGGGVPWTPAQLGAAVVGWWDASDPATITLNSGNVSAWASKVGGISATQATAASQPIYEPVSADGYPAIYNDGTRRLAISSLTGFPVGASAGVIALVGSTSSTVNANSQGAALGYGNASVSQARNVFLLNNAVVGDLDSSGPAVATSALNQSRIAIFSIPGPSNPQNASMAVDGGAPATASVSPVTGAGAGFVFGRAQFGDRYLIGRLREALVFNRALTNPETQTLGGYFAWKWGTVANLPSDHPYKNARP